MALFAEPWLNKQFFSFKLCLLSISSRIHEKKVYLKKIVTRSSIQFILIRIWILNVSNLHFLTLSYLACSSVTDFSSKNSHHWYRFIPVPLTIAYNTLLKAKFSYIVMSHSKKYGLEAYVCTGGRGDPPWTESFWPPPSSASEKRKKKIFGVADENWQF